MVEVTPELIELEHTRLREALSKAVKDRNYSDAMRLEAKLAVWEFIVVAHQGDPQIAALKEKLGI